MTNVSFESFKRTIFNSFQRTNDLFCTFYENYFYKFRGYKNMRVIEKYFCFFNYNEDILIKL